MDGINSEQHTLPPYPHSHNTVVYAGKEDALPHGPMLSIRMPAEYLVFLQIIHTAPVKQPALHSICKYHTLPGQKSFDNTPSQSFQGTHYPKINQPRRRLADGRHGQWGAGCSMLVLWSPQHFQKKAQSSRMPP